MSDAPDLTTAFLAPLPDGTAGGVDLTRDEEFRELAEEVQKGSSLAGEAPDWPRVLARGVALLQSQTKDLRIAGWVVVAKAQKNGWAGAAEGLGALAQLTAVAWDGMQPPVARVRARVSGIEWMWEALARALAPRAVIAGDDAHIRAVDALVGELDGLFKEKLGSANPGASPLRTRIRERARARTDLTPAGVATPSIPTDGVAKVQAVPARPALAEPALRSPAVPLPAIGPTPASLDAVGTGAERLRPFLGTLARQARHLAPASPWAYRLARVGAWLAIEEAPDATFGKTDLRAPRADERTALERMLTDGDWTDLRDQSEDALDEHIFWLDLHRFTARALDGLGPGHAAASEAVGRELVAFLARVPGLSALAFKNGTPFASPETLAWIAELQARFGGTTTAPRAAATGAGAELAITARDRAAGGQADAALGEALAAARALPNAADRFRARLALAKLAGTLEKHTAALALFGSLLPEVNDTLEAWAPAECVDLFESYLAALPHAPEGSAHAARQPLLFDRLLALDPAAALRSGG